jgi:hypothetical protein
LNLTSGFSDPYGVISRMYAMKSINSQSSTLIEGDDLFAKPPEPNRILEWIKDNLVIVIPSAVGFVILVFLLYKCCKTSPDSISSKKKWIRNHVVTVKKKKKDPASPVNQKNEVTQRQRDFTIQKPNTSLISGSTVSAQPVENNA